MNKTVVFLGAGFSKASGLKTTKELESKFLTLEATSATPDEDFQNHLSDLLKRFWRDVFGWRRTKKGTTPSLEDHFTLVDLAANTGHNLGPYTPRQLRAIRRISIHRIFDILDQGFTPSTAANELLSQLANGNDNAIVTSNWDTAAERYLSNNNKAYWYGFASHYVYGDQPELSGLPMLKLHGSSNWMYCDSCRRIFTGRPGGGKAAFHSWIFLHDDDLQALDSSFSSKPVQNYRNPYICQFCDVELSARVATFSFSKALGFFQFQSVWDQTLAALRAASRWIFIGYSLPQADFEIRALLKTAQMSDSKIDKREIIAVPGKRKDSQENYDKFFGSRAKVYSIYMDEWWKRQKTV